MANQGIYREAGAAGGLPLPRAGLMAFTIVVALLALLALGMAPMLLVIPGRGAAGAWRIFREGGGAMWLLLLIDLGMPLIVATLGAFAMRGRRVPTSLLFVSAALPFTIALLGSWLAGRMTLGAISGESVDPSQKARILAEGIAESMSADIFGGFVTCGIAIVAAAAAASALASIDVATASRGAPSPPRSGAMGAGIAGGAWILATLAIGVVRSRQAGPLVFLPVLPVLVIVPFAVLAGRGASVLRAWHDPGEAKRMAGAAIVAAFSAVLALLALQRGLEASFTSRAFSAIAGESVDPSQRMRILAEAVEAGRFGAPAYAIHAVLGLTTFGLAVLPAVGDGRHPMSASAAAAGIVGFVLLLSTFALAHFRNTAPEKIARASAAPPGVTLPVSIETFSDKAAGGEWGDRIVVMKDGTGSGAFEGECDGAHHVTLYADRAATLGMVRARLPKKGDCALQFSFVTTREHPPGMDEKLGELSAFLGTTGFVSGTIGDATDRSSSDGIFVKSVADDAIEIDHTRVAFPIPAGTPSNAAGDSYVRQFQYTFRPADTVDHALEVVAAVEQLYGARVSYTIERSIIIDDGTRPPPAASASNGLSVGGAIQVNGRLPPEVIQRIVRQNNARFRKCYEQGLSSDPTLHGRVTVKFVIDRSGDVASVSSAGSDLPNASVVTCITKQFQNLSFPQPEGGIVTVVYPLVFQSS